MPARLRKLDIVENRTEADAEEHLKRCQLIADNDTACCNCAHTFPYSNECGPCEQPNGPFTQRSNWKYRGHNKVVACPHCGKEGAAEKWSKDHESCTDDTELTCPFCGHTWTYSTE